VEVVEVEVVEVEVEAEVVLFVSVMKVVVSLIRGVIMCAKIYFVIMTLILCFILAIESLGFLPNLDFLI
jgi:hypothetical protein